MAPKMVEHSNLRQPNPGLRRDNLYTIGWKRYSKYLWVVARELAAVAGDGPRLRDRLPVHLEQRGLAKGGDASLHPGSAVRYDLVLEFNLQFQNEM